MGTTNPKVIAVAQALKRAFEMNAGPGAAVNAHPNAFFLNMNGAVDLYKAAEAAVARAEAFDEAAALAAAAQAAQAKAEAQLAVDETAASAVDAH